MFATFKEACMARELLEDDHEGRICLEEAIAMQPRIAYRRLLAVILLTDEVTEPHLLWDQFKAGLCDDVKHKLHHMNHYQADCHKLHLVISPPILRRFPRFQSQLKALKKTFRSIPVTSRGNQ